MKLSMQRTYVNNRWFEFVPTHYIIWSDWSRLRINELEDIVWATLNAEANQKWIHIEVVWNFNIDNPTSEQYNALNWLIMDINTKIGRVLPVKRHSDFQTKNCPWKNFDINKLNKTFNLSRYYSPLPNQSRYYNWKTYEQDKAMNCWPWDCMVPADGKLLTDKDIYKSVACPSEYKLGTKIYLKDIWVVICRDRGWSIQGNRLDLRMWAWTKALDNWDKWPTGIMQGFILIK